MDIYSSNKTSFLMGRLFGCYLLIRSCALACPYRLQGHLKSILFYIQAKSHRYFPLFPFRFFWFQYGCSTVIVKTYHPANTQFKRPDFVYLSLVYEMGT